MPLLDLSRQTTNTGDIIFEGTGNNQAKWTFDAAYSGTITADFAEASGGRIQVTAVSHGLTDLFNDNEVIEIDFSAGSYIDFPSTGNDREIYSIVDDNTFILKNQSDSSSNGIDWLATYADEGNNQPWTYNRGASRFSISNALGDVFYVDSLAGRTYIGGSLDIAGTAAILDVGEIQLEDAVLELNFTAGSESTLSNNAQAGFKVGDTTAVGANAPAWLFNKGATGAVSDSYWEILFRGEESHLHTADITASGITASAGISATGNISTQGTLASLGSLAVNTSKFTANATSGDVSIAGILTQTGTANIGGGYGSAGITLTNAGAAQIAASLELNGSTAVTSLVENADNIALTDNSHTSIPTALSVIRHVAESQKKVLAYVNGLNHHAHTTIGAHDTGTNHQLVTWSGIKAADNFSTSGTMAYSDYQCTVNGLNIEPHAIVSLEDRTDSGAGYIDLTFNTTLLDFALDQSDEVVLSGPTQAATGA